VPLDGVTVGAGAVWAFSGRRATVVRIDPARGAVTDEVRIVARRGSQAPFPIGIASTAEAVWVLNGNTASVSRIDPETRGVTATVAIGVDRVPRHIAAAGRTVWVANFDGTLSRIDAGGDRATSLWVGESLSMGAGEGNGQRVWVTTAALDQELPGGAS
jgi:DNA-binding beta-propeller fold protein YncE